MAKPDLSGLKHGALHKALGIPMDQPIPADKLREAKRSNNPHVRAMATLAMNMKKWKKK